MSEIADRSVAALLQEIETVKRSTADDAERDALVADLHVAVNLILSHADARAEERERFARWQAIVPQCRAAKERFDKLNAEAEKQNVILAQARAAADDAESKLNLRRDARPAPYPTSQEISDWQALCKKLENSLKAARACVRAANQHRGELTAELLRARNEFMNLVFRERNLRGKQPQPIYQGVELAGVR